MVDHTELNRRHWDEAAAAWHGPLARDHWSKTEPQWGLWATPESQLRLLPADLSGLDVIELGCGTAYVSAWLARLGARPVGIDISAAEGCREAAEFLVPGTAHDRFMHSIGRFAPSCRALRHIEGNSDFAEPVAGRPAHHAGEGMHG